MNDRLRLLLITLVLLSSSFLFLIFVFDIPRENQKKAIAYAPDMIIEPGMIEVPNNLRTEGNLQRLLRNAHDPALPQTKSKVEEKAPSTLPIITVEQKEPSPKFKIIGRIIDETGIEWWYISPSPGQRTVRLKIGMDIEGWTLSSVSERELTFKKGTQNYEINK